MRLSDPIRDRAIRVRSIVVVGVAAGIDIPRIVRIATIRRPQTAILSSTYIPKILISRRVGGTPCADEIPSFDHFSRPKADALPG